LVFNDIHGTMVVSLLFDLEKGTRPVLDLLRNDDVIQSVKYIRVEYWGDGNVLVSDEELITIFGIIGRLPRIKELIIEFDELPLPAKALRNALSCSTSRLRFLALEDVRISGTLQDFKDVAAAIQQSRSLRAVRLYRCGPAFDSRASLDPIIAALASVPTLKDITISSTHCSEEVLGMLGESNSLEVVAMDHMTISGPSLRQLCQSRSIQDLKFWGMPELDENATYLTSALVSNQALKILRIRYCRLHQESARLLSDMLYRNSQLESLSLENVHWKDFGTSLQKSLTSNKSLKSLSLSIDDKDIDLSSNVANLTTGLEKNTGLRKFRLLLREMDGQAVRKAFSKPILDMLQNNYTLESIYINNNSMLDEGMISILLKLNRTRKRHLLRDECSTKLHFVDMLAAHSADVSITHYVMSMNPAIFLP